MITYTSQINKTKEMGKAIAQYLEGWEFLDTHDEADWRILLENRSIEGIATLIFRLEKGRLTIRGSSSYESERFERTQRLGFWGQKAAPSISVSAKRTPEAIAKDLQRRLIPQYLEWRKVETAKLWEQVAEIRKTEGILRRLSNLLGTEPRPDWVADIQTFDRKLWGGTGSKIDKVEVGYQNAIDITLRDVSIEQAEQVIQIFRPTESA